MLIDTRFRTNAPEIMDDFSIEGEELRQTLDEIAAINRLLGGNSVTVQGVAQLLQKMPKTETITILDIGCGNGDMLRTLSDFATAHGWDFELFGIDANTATVGYAKELSALYPNITYLSEDVFAADFEKHQYDIALCTLTLHHFSDDEILRLIGALKEQATIGIVINDLHRNGLAYRLFQVFSWIFRLGNMPKSDGLVSILRGFKKEELVGFSKKLNISNYSIRWKWAFRYQWIISKI